jgi:hypothetical protein
MISTFTRVTHLVTQITRAVRFPRSNEGYGAKHGG